MISLSAPKQIIIMNFITQPENIEKIGIELFFESSSQTAFLSNAIVTRYFASTEYIKTCQIFNAHKQCTVLHIVNIFEYTFIAIL